MQLRILEMLDAYLHTEVHDTPIFFLKPDESFSLVSQEPECYFLLIGLTQEVGGKFGEGVCDVSQTHESDDGCGTILAS